MRQDRVHTHVLEFKIFEVEVRTSQNEPWASIYQPDRRLQACMLTCSNRPHQLAGEASMIGIHNAASLLHDRPGDQCIIIYGPWCHPRLINNMSTLLSTVQYDLLSNKPNVQTHTTHLRERRQSIQFNIIVYVALVGEDHQVPISHSITLIRPYYVASSVPSCCHILSHKS